MLGNERVGLLFLRNLLGLLEALRRYEPTCGYTASP